MSPATQQDASTPKRSSRKAKKTPKGDYSVGYARPPVNTRFTPGVSGNPKGRPAGRPNLKTELAQILNETVQVSEGGKVKHLPKRQLLLRTTLNNAIKGDSRAFNNIISFMARVGSLNESGDDTPALLPLQDQEIAHDFLRRNAAAATNPANDSEKRK
jgi:Family of unknown function (DUF5681)